MATSAPRSAASTAARMPARPPPMTTTSCLITWTFPGVEKSFASLYYSGLRIPHDLSGTSRQGWFLGAYDFGRGLLNGGQRIRDRFLRPTGFRPDGRRDARGFHVLARLDQFLQIVRVFEKPHEGQRYVGKGL